MRKISVLLSSTICMVALSGLASAEDWKPKRQVELVVTSGPGGAGDIFGRAIQSAIIKNNLLDQATVIQNKGAANGAEGIAYVGKDDEYKLLITQSNPWLKPMISRVGYKTTDVEPLAVMAMDLFILWVPTNSPYKDAKSYIDFARVNPGVMKMGGANSKDADEILTKLIEKSEGVQLTYIPFKSGAEAAVRLAGNVVDSNVNNPGENISYWRAGQVRPLCVFDTKRMAAGPKITSDMGWSDIPTCLEAGLKTDKFEYPRVVFLPAGASDASKAFYRNLLDQIRQKPEFKDYIAQTVQVDPFITGKVLTDFIKDDEKRNRDIFESVGWIVK